MRAVARMIATELKLPRELIEKIDEFRAKQPIKPTRSAAIRYLIDLGLDHATTPHRTSPNVK
jgi:metal-responsive CopG/Arc/MetJ family transcriptional regulator